MRLNHQNFSNSKRNFAPTAILTKFGIVPISAARQSSSRAATPVSAARPINTAVPKPFVNVAKTKKSHSLSRRPFYQQTTLKNKNLKDKVNTAMVISVNIAKGNRVTSVVGEQGINVVKSSACWVWRPKIKETSPISQIIKNMMEDLLHLQAALNEMCDKKNSVLFTKTECLILSPGFKLPNENQVLLKVPRKNNMYSFDLKNVVPSKGLTYLFAKATNDESKLWHRRLGHINFKTMNKLVKGNLVRGLPSNIFENDHTYVACQKGKQHKATWIKMEFSNARTPKQNGLAERKNRTLIEATRTMLADSLLPIPFWAKADITACYVQNKVLVTKPHNKTPYELLIGTTPIISFMRPFGCPVTILNTLDHLGKFDGKADEGFLVGYSINSKAFRVFNSRTRKVEENLHVNFLENKPIMAGNGPKWMFDIDSLTNSMNYQPVSAGNRTNGYSGLEPNSDAGQAGKEKVPDQEYILLPLLHTSSYVPSSSKEAEATNTNNTNRLNTVSSPVNAASSSFTIVEPGRERGQRNEFESLFGQDKDASNVYRVFTPVNAATPSNTNYPTDLLMLDLEDTANLQDTGIFGNAYDNEDVGAEVDINNLETTMSVSPILTTRVHKDHPKYQIIGEMEPKKLTRALDDERWVEAMQEELLQFKLLNVWTLVDLPYGKKAIGTKLVFRNKKDQKGIVVRNKARLVAQEEEVYVSQPLGFVDPEFPNKVYKVEKALYGLHQAHRACVKIASTPMETHKPLSKDADGTDVDVHLYRFQVQLKASHMHAVKRIFRYLKGQPTLGLWYPKDSPMDLIAYSDSDYSGASLDRKSTKGGCRFLGCRLISWQCKKQTIVANSTTEAEYIAASNCYYNVVDLLTKAFDVSMFQFLIASIELKGYLINDGYADFVRMLFWNTATSKTINSVKQIHAIVDGKTVVISESSVRSDLLFDDEDGITCLTNDEIFENLTLMGYEQLSTKLTFQKGSFSPQWKFLIHTILHCISSKSTAWNEFSTNLASAVICLAKGQNFNFSKLIFDGMLRNLDSKKFLMYLRFLQLFLNNQLKDLPEPFNDTYVTPCHTKKVFLNMARKSVNFLGKITPLFASMLVQNQAPEGKGSTIPLEPQPTPSTSQPIVSEPQIKSLQIETPPTAAPQAEVSQAVVSPSPTTYQRKRKTHKRRRTKKDIELPQTSVPQNLGADEAVHKEGGDSVERAITIDASLDAAQDSDNILKTQSTTRSERVLEQPNEPPLSEGHTSRSGEGRMEKTFELTDNVPPTPHYSPLIGGYTPGSDEAVEILNLKKRVKKLERKRQSSISHLRRRKYRQVETSSDDDLDKKDASKQGRRSDKIKPMFKDKDFEELDDHMDNVHEETVDATTTGVSTVSAPVTYAGVTISTAEPRTPTTTTVFDDKDVTMAMAQTLIKMKEHKAKEKGVAITDVEDFSRSVRPVRSITTLQPLPTIDPKDKELAQRLHEKELAELDRVQQERQRQKEATSAALAKEFDEIQARIDADHELAVRLTHEEQEKYTIEERAREKKWIDDFKPMDTEVIKDSEKKDNSSSKPAGGSKRKTLARKRTGENQSKESAKRQKLEDAAEEQESAESDEEVVADYEQEKEELRMWLTVVPDEEETVDPEILSAKYPIVDWESQNLGSIDMEDLHVYKIIRADGNTSYHKSLFSMLKKFNIQDLVDLHRLVMKRFENTTLEGYNLLLWGDLKLMFEPNVEDAIWSNKQDWTLIS
ncbi:putative ribonuclease H-like domain-containing protein [Tanacetum coccineum]